MDLPSAQSFFWAAFGIALLLIAISASWMLVEAALLIRQGQRTARSARLVVDAVAGDFFDMRSTLGRFLGTIVGFVDGFGQIAGAVKKVRKAAGSRRRT